MQMEMQRILAGSNTTILAESAVGDNAEAVGIGAYRRSKLVEGKRVVNVMKVGLVSRRVSGRIGHRQKLLDVMAQGLCESVESPGPVLLTPLVAKYWIELETGEKVGVELADGSDIDDLRRAIKEIFKNRFARVDRVDLLVSTSKNGPVLDAENSLFPGTRFFVKCTLPQGMLCSFDHHHLLPPLT
jgi:hypothetical protein